MTFPSSRGDRSWMHPPDPDPVRDEFWCPVCERAVTLMAEDACLACNDEKERR